MAGEAKPEKEKAPKTEREKAPPKKQLTRAAKQAQHMDRLKRTAVACMMGILAGALSFFGDTVRQGRPSASSFFSRESSSRSTSSSP